MRSWILGSSEFQLMATSPACTLSRLAPERLTMRLATQPPEGRAGCADRITGARLHPTPALLRGLRRVLHPVPSKDALLRLSRPGEERIGIAAVREPDLQRYGVEPAVGAAVKSAAASTSASRG